MDKSALPPQRERRELPGRMHGKHSHKNPNFMSPAWLTAAARKVLGRIDLDPASDQEANKMIKAKRIFTVTDDGLRKSWSDGRSVKIFLNPPGGLVRTAAARAALPKQLSASRSSAAIWWYKLCTEYAQCDDLEAIFVGFSIELLQSCQAFAECERFRHPLEFPCCFPRERISFVTLDENGDRRVAGMPGHGNVIVYLPPQGLLEPEARRSMNRFRSVFEEHGYIHLP